MINLVKKMNFEEKSIVGGVAYDGKNIWYAIHTFNGNERLSKLVYIDKKTGKTLKEFINPEIGTGTAWDGTHLWQVCKNKIYKIDTTTGNFISPIAVPDEGFISGLAWDGKNLLVGSFDNKKIYKVDTNSGKVLEEITIDKYVTGITFINENLCYAGQDNKDDKTNSLYFVDKKTGLTENIKADFCISGLSNDGEMLWCGDCVEGNLRAIDNPFIK